MSSNSNLSIIMDKRHTVYTAVQMYGDWFLQNKEVAIINIFNFQQPRIRM